MIYSPQDEQALMAALWRPEMVNSPLTFVRFAFPWGKPNTPLANHKGPRRWQVRFLMEIEEHIVANNFRAPDMWEVLQKAAKSGRGIGKSALVCWLINWFMTTRIGGSVIVSANTEYQLRTVTWAELSKWTAMSINAHWWDMIATKLTPQKWLAELVERDLKKGTRYWAAEAKLWSEENPDGYAGVHNPDGVLLVFDEASGIPDTIWPVAGGYFTEQTKDRYWFAFSNPRRRTGHFFEIWNAKRDFWQSTTVDARTVEGTDTKVYDKIIAEYGADSREAKVEVYGEFPDSDEEGFISGSIVEAAQARPRYNDSSAGVIIGVDPARSGGDKTVMVVRQGRDVMHIERHRGDDTMQTVGNVIKMIQRYKPQLVVIDEGGLGAGVLDRLLEQGFREVRGVNFGSTPDDERAWGNKRAEMWGGMKEWLRSASIPKDRDLQTDLTGVRLKPSSSGRMFLESKRDMKSRGLASPDAADALAVTFAYSIASRFVKFVQPRFSIA